MQITDVRLVAQKRSTGQLDLIDVRTPVEYREVHADGALMLAKMPWNRCGDSEACSS